MVDPDLTAGSRLTSRYVPDYVRLFDQFTRQNKLSHIKQYFFVLKRQGMLGINKLSIRIVNLHNKSQISIMISENQEIR